MQHKFPRIFVSLLLLAVLAGCGTSGTSPANVSPTVATISISSPLPSIAVSGTEQISATAKDSSGNAINGIAFAWASSTSPVAIINAANGVATGLLPGTTQITASANGVTSAPLTLTVTPGFLNIETLNTARSSTTITMLNTGQALIAAGINSAGIVNSAELYNPATNTFGFTGSLNTPRYDHTATLLDNGKVLVVGGWNASGVLGSAELYDPTSGTFVNTGSLSTARTLHTATHLQNGMVLIAGGSNGTTTDYASAELYDSTTGAFTPTGNLNFARRLATATLLNDGTVLIAGGIDSTGIALASAEIYDPTTGSFTLTGNLATARGFHTATLLNGGKVLISGGAILTGTTFVPFASAELYDPATRSFTASGSLNTSRAVPSATLLNNGTVLVAGGTNPGNPTTIVLTSAEIYDPSSGTFAPTGSLNAPHSKQASVLLPNGDVLLAGNFDLPVKAPAELYEPATFTPPGLQSITLSPQIATIATSEFQTFVAAGIFLNGTQRLVSVTWASDETTAVISNDSSNPGASYAPAGPPGPSPLEITAAAGNVRGAASLSVRYAGFVSTGNMSIQREVFKATLLNNGMVLVADGDVTVGGPAPAELYNPASGTFSFTGAPSTSRYFFTATLLRNGKVLIAGGTFEGSVWSSAELYDPVSGTFAPTGRMNVARLYHTATLLNNGMVLITGGSTFSSTIDSAELYDPAAGTFSLVGNLNTARGGHTATLLRDGTVLIAGGQIPGGFITTGTELYNPTTESFTVAASMNVAHVFHTATLLQDGTVLIAGGQDNNSFLANAEIYSPSTQLFTLTGSMATPRGAHTATLLNSGMVLVTGGGNNLSSSSGTLASTELYNPATGIFTSAGSLITGRTDHAATLLDNGMVLVVGGTGGSVLTSAELF